MIDQDWSERSCEVGSGNAFPFETVGLYFVTEFIPNKPFKKILKAVASLDTIASSEDTSLLCTPPAPPRLMLSLPPKYTPAGTPTGIAFVNYNPAASFCPNVVLSNNQIQYYE